MRFKIIGFLGILLAPALASAQSFERQVYSSSGGSNNNITWTLGEPVVSSLLGTSNDITQGFQQPMQSEITATFSLENQQIEFSLFPNPTKGDFTVKLKYPVNNAVAKIVISDLLGNTVFFTTTTLEYSNLTLENFHSGIYFISIHDVDNNRLSTLPVVKN